MSQTFDRNERPDYDAVIQAITDYVSEQHTFSDEALRTARYCLMDTLGCGLLALQFPACTKLLGPVVPGTQVPFGVRVPGTDLSLDPIKGAWDIGATIRWLDYNDTWLAAEWGHPSDNLGALLAVMDHLSQKRVASGGPPFTVAQLLEAMVKAHEIQGVLALDNSFNRVGLDHVLLVRVASTAVATWLMGGTREQILSAVSHAWVDGSALRTYRHAPNAGPRKSWAAGDACARAVRLADIALRGEPGVPGALSAAKWGFQDVSFSTTNADHQLKPPEQRQVRLSQPLGSYVMENILFKVSFPAEFHAQTAAEAAVTLHQQVKGRADEIDRVALHTHESAIRIISKVGALDNPADRDHCLQYMTAVPLLFGALTADHYEDDFHHAHPEIDALREKMTVREDPVYSRDYLDPDKRSIANAVQVFFRDGTHTDKVVVEYPLGHRRRREEAIPRLIDKFHRNASSQFGAERAAALVALFEDSGRLGQMPVHQFVAHFVAG